MSLDLLCMAAVPDSSSAFISHLQHRLAVKQAQRCGALDNMIILFINLFYPPALTPPHKHTKPQAFWHVGVCPSRRGVSVCGWGRGVLRVTFITWQFAGRCEDPHPHPSPRRHLFSRFTRCC